MMDMKRVEEIENMDIQLHKDKIDFLIQTIKQQQEQLELIRKDTYCEDTDYISMKHVIRKRAEKALEQPHESD